MHSSPPLPRCLGVWLGATAGLAGLTALALPVASAPPPAAGGSFEQWLVRGCAVALLVCAAWLWCGTTALLVRARTGRVPGTAWLPAPVRRAVLAGCGLAVLGAGPATAATAAEPDAASGSPAHSTWTPASGPSGQSTLDAVLDGLPLPERAVGGGSATDRVARSATIGAATAILRTGERVHLVRSGDTLWAIAAAALPPDASDAAIDTYWRLVHQRNRGAIGPDPDLIHPGTRLVLPPPGG